MEVDPPLLNSTTIDSPTLHSQGTQDSDHPSPEHFQLNTEQIKRILAFGKDLQRLYDSVTTGRPNDKLKVLLQVAQTAAIYPQCATWSRTFNNTLIIYRTLSAC